MTTKDIILSTNDYFLLQGLILPWGREWELLGTMLRRKLDRAVVAFPEDIGPDYVRIGSLVRFSSATGVEERLLAGHAGQPASGELSLRSTRGLALLGARAGQTLFVPVQDGGIETLQLLEVVQHPGATGEPSVAEAAAPAPDHRVVPFLPRMARAVRAIETHDDPGPSAA